MFPIQDPSKKDRKPLPWTILKMVGVKEKKCWLAGETIWVETHHNNVSLPCWWIMTQGKLECPLCKKKPRIDWTGYVPLYDEGGAPVVAVVRESARARLLECRVHDPVAVKKGADKFDKTCVVPMNWAQPWNPGRDGGRGEVDLREWLLVTVWGQDALTDFFRAHPCREKLPTNHASDTAVSQQGEGVADAKDEAEKEYLRRVQGGGPRKDAPTIGDVTDRLVREKAGGHHGLNGKPKPAE